MPGAALKVSFKGVGKRYRVGEGSRAPAHFRDALRGVATRAGRRRGRGDESYMWSLSDVDLDVHEGEVLGVVGRNGAGKSTLLKLLTRVTYPTKGRVSVNGRVGALLEVGTGFHPELTGRENVFLNGAILGMSKRQTKLRFEEIVEFAGVERFMDTPVKRYSSGMFLRLAFSVAAHLEADVLAIDEVLAVGDVEFQRKCLGKIDGLSKSGRTILFVSHDLGAVHRLCTRACWLESGRVSAVGRPGEIIETYLGAISTGMAPGARLNEGHALGHVEGVWCQDRSGMTRTAYSVGEEIVVRLDVSVERTIRGGGLSIQVITRDGVQVLDEGWSPSEQFGGVLERGRYRAAVAIPPVLNVGEYSLGVWFGSAYETIAHAEGVGGFSIHGGGGGHDDCLVRLSLPWDVAREGA